MLVSLLSAAASAACAEGAGALSSLSLEQLANVQVTSVSKRAESAADAPASIFVITHDDIASAGATTLPEMLRLAPNLQVEQVSASKYVITARGLNGSPGTQNFANKLLVLIDGRTVYSPLFSGIYWDMQDVLPQDIDRIEVISGPGATLWGANAVNGVINIITRSTVETQGALVAATLGDQSRSVMLRYGGRLGADLTYRLYAKTFFDDDTRLPGGARANDHWSRPQGGFRLDYAPGEGDALTLQGDLYRGFEAQLAAPSEIVSGGNVTGRWTHTTAGGELQVQAYYDRAARSAEVDGSGFQVDTYDVDLQHSFAIGRANDVVWGGGLRRVRYGIDGTATLLWSPSGRDLTQGNLFLQDTLSLRPDLKLTLGAKVESDAFSAPELLPNARLAWSVTDDLTLWGAVSRAVRSPTPFDHDVVEKVGEAVYLEGGSDFRSEVLTAYEVGAKVRLGSRASLAVTGFYDDYSRLRSIEITPTVFLPLRWGNDMAGYAYGIEAWGEYQPADWWRLSASLNTLEERFHFTPGASGLVGLSQAANDPKYQAALRSSMTLPHRISFDVQARYVSALPEPRVPSYLEADAQLSWTLSDRWRLSLVGSNLLHARHVEYVGGDEIPRAVLVGLQWGF